jgi:hypothetical protein
LEAVNARQDGQIMGELRVRAFEVKDGWERVQVMEEIAVLQPENASQWWLSGKLTRIAVCLNYNDAQHKKQSRFPISSWDWPPRHPRTQTAGITNLRTC